MDREFVGKGSIRHLAEILEQEKPKTILLVTSKEAYEKSRAQAMFASLLERFQVFTFSEFRENPKIEDIQKGIELFRRVFPDLVLAVGGGSALDVAKSVNVLANQSGEALEYVFKEKEIMRQGQPLVAIPTTAGTGAEATHFAVTYVQGTKHSLSHPFVLPTYSIVDPQLTYSLPSSITAATGMDALCQAIESYWSNKSTEESKRYARDAISCILPNIASAVNNPSPEAREAMSRGAHLSGKAINISQTTACHAISYHITSFFGVPHGHAVALTISSMVLFNSEVDTATVQDARGVEYVKKTMKEVFDFFFVKSGTETKKALEDLMISIHLKTRLSDLGIQTEQDRERIVKNGFHPERVKNNPRILTEQDLRALVANIQ